MQKRLKTIGWYFLPVIGILGALVVWSVMSATVATNLPSPWKTWEMSKPYVVKPFEKRGELDQGILRFTWFSLLLVAKGYTIALLVGTPLGFLLGVSKVFSKS